MFKVRFLQDGRWSDKPWLPVFDVKAGDVKSVSAELAKVATQAGKAVIVQDNPQKIEDKPKPIEEKIQKPPENKHFSRFDNKRKSSSYTNMSKNAGFGNDELL